MTFQFFNGFYIEYKGIRSISIPHRDYYNIDEIVVPPVIDQIFSVYATIHPSNHSRSKNQIGLAFGKQNSHGILEFIIQIEMPK